MEHGGEDLGQRFLLAAEQSFTRLLEHPNSGTRRHSPIRIWPA
nr:hypothetical protein [Rhizobium sp. J15]